MNKSTVCRIANRISRDIPRHEAFVQAWAIVKAGTLELSVRGVSFGNRQEALRRLAAYNPAQVRAVLVPEPANPVDPAAVAVMVGVQGGKGLYRLGVMCPGPWPRSWLPWAGPPAFRRCGLCPAPGAGPTRPPSGQGWPWQCKGVRA
jgi:hypothetical protein